MMGQGLSSGHPRRHFSFLAISPENATWTGYGVYETRKAILGLRPDLIIGHSGFGPTGFLRELCDCPSIGNEDDDIAH